MTRLLVLDQLSGQDGPPYTQCLYRMYTPLMATTTGTRSQRWNLRVAADEDELVRQAAELTEEGLTGFVRDAAIQEAKRVLADRQVFPVADADWQRFNELLDRPAEVPEGLQRLFAKSSVFDD